MEIRELQKYIKDRDYKPKLIDKYFIKLVEETGELARCIRKDKKMENSEIKDTIEEELYDVLYYVCAIANCYDIDLEKCHELKTVINNKKWYSNK